MPATRGLKKDTNRAITPVMEAVYVPAHLMPPVSPQTKQLRHLHIQFSLGQSCHSQKNSCVYAGVALVMSDSSRPCRLWPARLLCQGDSPGKNTRAYWPILVAIPFLSTIFPAALPANYPKYLVLPEPLQSKQLHHLHTWPSQGQTQVLQGSLRRNPQWTAHM